MVPLGSRLQEMKLKDSATRKIAAFGMSLYTVRSIGSQLCRLAMTLSLLALPLAGAKPERAPILIPLGTEFVPLGTSLQSHAPTLFQPPSFAVPARLVLGPLPSAVFAPNPARGGRLLIITSPSFADSGAIDSPNGRSPPCD